MNENEFDWSDSWALLALFAMAASMNNPEPPSDIPKCCYPRPIDDGRGFMQADTNYSRRVHNRTNESGSYE